MSGKSSGARQHARTRFAATGSRTELWTLCHDVLPLKKCLSVNERGLCGEAGLVSAQAACHIVEPSEAIRYCLHLRPHSQGKGRGFIRSGIRKYGKGECGQLSYELSHRQCHAVPRFPRFKSHSSQGGLEVFVISHLHYWSPTKPEPGWAPGGSRQRAAA
jgi:hypothetical protein